MPGLHEGLAPLALGDDLSPSSSQCPCCDRKHPVEQCCCNAGPPTTLASRWRPGKQLLFCSNLTKCSFASSNINGTGFVVYDFEADWERHLVNIPTDRVLGICVGVSSASLRGKMTRVDPCGFPGDKALAMGSENFPVLRKLLRRAKQSPQYSRIAFCRSNGVFAYIPEIR